MSARAGAVDDDSQWQDHLPQLSHLEAEKLYFLKNISLNSFTILAGLTPPMLDAFVCEFIFCAKFWIFYFLIIIVQARTLHRMVSWAVRWILMFTFKIMICDILQSLSTSIILWIVNKSQTVIFLSLGILRSITVRRIRTRLSEEQWCFFSWYHEDESCTDNCILHNILIFDELNWWCKRDQKWTI